MKNITLISLLILSSLITNAQFVKEQVFKVDTVTGHGYEVMFMGSPLTKKVYLNTDAGVKSVNKEFYRPGDYTWDQVMTKFDSLKNLSQRWILPSTNQLRTIFTISQSILDNKKIRVGSNEFQGIYGIFWCYDGQFNGLPNIPSVNLGGSFNSRDFKVGDAYEADPNNKTGKVVYIIIKSKKQLLFIRKY